MGVGCYPCTMFYQSDPRTLSWTIKGGLLKTGDMWWYIWVNYIDFDLKYPENIRKKLRFLIWDSSPVPSPFFQWRRKWWSLQVKSRPSLQQPSGHRCPRGTGSMSWERKQLRGGKTGRERGEDGFTKKFDVFLRVSWWCFGATLELKIKIYCVALKWQVWSSQGLAVFLELMSRVLLCTHQVFLCMVRGTFCRSCWSQLIKLLLSNCRPALPSCLHVAKLNSHMSWDGKFHSIFMYI